MTKRTISFAIMAVLLLCGAVWAWGPMMVGQGVSVEAAPTNTLSYLIAQNSSSPSTTATRYARFSGDGSNSWGTSSSSCDVIPTGGTLTDFQVQVAVAPGASASWTFTVMSGSTPSDTDLSVTIADSAVKSSLDTSTVAVSAGDKVILKAVPSGGTA